MPVLTTTRNNQEKAIDVANLIAGLALIISPWLFGFADMQTAAWTAWITGLLIAAVALGALVAYRQWEEWVNVVLGLWAVVSPWLLGFASDGNAMLTHVVLGLLVAVLAAFELWTEHNRTPSSV